MDVAQAAGLTHRTVFGGSDKNTYILETTGTGVAFLDYDNDGILDLFFANGTTLGAPASGAVRSHLYHGIGGGTFTDVTEKAGVGRSGWGQGIAVGDYDNDGFADLYLTFYGRNILFRNNRNGTFTDSTKKPVSAAVDGAPAQRGRTTTTTAFWICSLRDTSTSIWPPLRYLALMCQASTARIAESR